MSIASRWVPRPPGENLSIVSRWAPILIGAGIVASSAVFGIARAISAPHPAPELIAVGLFLAVHAVSATIRPGQPLPTAVILADVAVVPVMAILSTPNVDPHADFTAGAWWLGGAIAIVGLLVARGAPRAAVIAFTLLVVHTVVWAGPIGLLRFRVVGALLLLGVIAFAARAERIARREVERFGVSSARSLEWEAARAATHEERQVRLTRAADLSAPMLRTIAEHGGRLSANDRFECRLLEQTVRDELRGRRLLNDAVREQVLAARRRGASVQVHDDGGLDDLPPHVMDPLLDQVAAAMATLSSDQVILRTASPETGKALTLAGLSVDPVAAALGLDDEEETVDLWLELDRPGADLVAVG